MIVVFMLILLGTGLFILTLEEMKDFYLGIKDWMKEWIKGFRYDYSEGPFPADAGKPAHGLPDPGGHIRLMLQLTMSLGTDRAVRAFAALSVGPALAVCVLLWPVVRTELALAAGLMAGALPYAFLQLRLQKMRVDSSREGEILITEILSNYKTCYFNMQKAVEETAESIEEAPVCRRLLFNLSRGLNRAGTEKDIDTLLREFRLSINTSWGNILARNMFFALSSGIEVTEALTDLADTVKMARKIDEYARRENNESVLIFRYLVPAAYMMAPVMGTGMMGLSMEEFLYYQFETEVGLTWFTISLILYISGMLAGSFLGRGKLDF